MSNFSNLTINPILKIQKFPFGMLIFRQKYFQYCIPHLKSRQPVLPYLVVSKNKWKMDQIFKFSQNIWTLKAKMFSHQDPVTNPDIKQSETNNNLFQAVEVNQSTPKIGCNATYLKSCSGFLKIFALVRNFMIHSL